MKFQLKSRIKRILPQSLVNALQLLLNLPQTLERTLEKRRTQRIFTVTIDGPSYLDINALETLQKKYPHRRYEYDPHTLEVRGMERATQILHLPKAQEAHSFLELGCGDGMVSCCLRRKGKETTAVDNTDAEFNKRASDEGVSLLQMDAADLRFEDESFDFVFSYDAFEHFASPEDVLRETIRVTKKGGYIYLNFGPLYYSSQGEHAYHSITVPYCQFLFKKDLINDFATQKGLAPIDFSYVNGWPLENYRELWNKYSQVLKRVSYKESPDLYHLDLISTYPSCFRGKSNNFENFITGNITVLSCFTSKFID